MSNSESTSVAGNGVLDNTVTSNVANPATAKPAPASNESTEANDGASTPDDEPNVPRRLRGKSEAERIEAFKTVESELGRKNNEIGQLRYAIDQMLQLRKADDAAAATKASAKKPEPVTGEALLTDPEATIASVVERVVESKAGGTQDRLERLEFERKKDTFSAKFPKYEETMADDGFKDWIKGSPYRQRLAAAAAQNGSFEAAEELFGLYDETVVAVKQARVTGNDPNAAAAAASLVKPGNGNTTGGANKKTVTGALTSKTIYKRSELADLYQRDRDAYNAQMPEVMRAYKEGRVR